VGDHGQIDDDLKNYAIVDERRGFYNLYYFIGVRVWWLNSDILLAPTEVIGGYYHNSRRSGNSMKSFPFSQRFRLIPSERIRSLQGNYLVVSG
jgi:hypothetical protein